MKRLTLAAFFFLSCLSSPILAQQPKNSAFVQAVPLCAVIASAAKYDGKEIVVRGLYRMVIHGVILMDRTCSKTYVNLREAAGYKANKQALTLLQSLTKKNQFQTVDVVFRGIFRVAHEGQCFGQICASYEIETTELIAARPTPPESSSAANRPSVDTIARELGSIGGTSAIGSVMTSSRCRPISYTTAFHTLCISATS